MTEYYKAYAGNISSAELQSKTLVGGVMTYQYIITLDLTEIITGIEDTYEAGTDIVVDLSNSDNVRSITGITRFSSNDGITSIPYYCDFNEDGQFHAFVTSYKGGTVDVIGTFPATGSSIWLNPAPPTITVQNVTESGRAYRRVQAYHNGLTNKVFYLEAHYMDTEGNWQVQEFERAKTAPYTYFTILDDNVYPTSRVTYKAKFISVQPDYTSQSGMEFESIITEEDIDPWLQPFPATLYGPRARRGHLKDYLLYKSVDGMQLNWVFNSSDGSSQTQYDCEIRGDVDVSKNGLSNQNCYFSPAEIGGPDIDDAFLVILDTYGAGSIPSQVIDFAYCIADLNLTITYSYTLLTSTIDISIAGPSATVVDSLEFIAHISLKDENDEIVYTATNSSFFADGHVEFTIDINEIEGYNPDIDYTLDYTVFSNILEDFSFSGSETLSNPTFTRPAEPTVTVEVVDDYCYIDVTTDANAKYIDLICRYADEEFYIARRAEIADAEAHYRFNTPPIGVEFEIYAKAYGDFYMPSDETDGVDGFVPCNSNVYVNYESDEDTTYSKYTEKFAVRVNAAFGESIANNLQQYSIIGKYDAVTKLEDNAKREMSLNGEITYGPQDIQLFESFIKTAKKCVIRIPKGNVFYCYISSADLKKDAGSRNAKLGLKLLIDSFIAAEQTVTYNACEATLAYVERVLADLLVGE